MDVRKIFGQMLGLQEPWEVVELEFKVEEKRLDIRVAFPRGSKFPCPDCSAICGVHDTVEREWRHLNIFEHMCFLKSKQPRTKCGKHGVKTAAVPWARPGSGFTLLMEAAIMMFGQRGLTPTAIERVIGEHDTRIWRVLEHYVDEARSRAGFENVEKVGIDETSRAKGHVYVTVVCDAEEKRVLFVTEGKDHRTVSAFKEDLVAHGGDPAKVTDFSLDMSKAFIKGIRQEFPKAHLTFDRFHVIKLMNEAVDEVRRQEQKARPELKKTRFLWLRNEENIVPDDWARFQMLKDSTLDTALAYRLRLALQDLYLQPTRFARSFFKKWIAWAGTSRLEPVIRVAKTIEAHMDGILRWFTSRMSNGLLEGINSLIQAAKAKARGFRSSRKMAVMIYLLLAKLDFRLPAPFPSAIHSK